jgi:hypothetical protein
MQVSGNRNLIKNIYIYIYIIKNKKKNRDIIKALLENLRSNGKLVLHSAGFKREQSRQRSTRITQTKSTGKEKKAWDMQTEVGERGREREYLVWLAFVLLFTLAAATVGFATFAKSVVCSRPPALCRFCIYCRC